MKLIIIFVFLVLSECYQYKQKSLLKRINTILSRKAKRIGGIEPDSEGVIYKTKQCLEKDKLKNKEFIDNHQKKPGGRDEHKYEAKFEHVKLRIMDGITSQDSGFQNINLYYNSNGLIYFSEIDGDYLTLLDSVNLLLLASDKDDLKIGQCCNFMANVEQVIIQDEVGHEADLFCFNVFAQTTTWTICKETLASANILKNNLIKNTIQSYYIHMNIDVPSILEKDESKIGDMENAQWDYDLQSHWFGKCQSGNYQSPINIDLAKLTEAEDQSLKFSYSGISRAISDYDGNDVFIKGNFGYFKHKQGKVERKFDVIKFNFKFNSEHSVDQNFTFGEMQIHHESEDGTQAIVSIFLEPSKDTLETDFWLNLNPFAWLPQDTSQTSSTITLFELIDLNDMHSDGFNDYMDTSFFYYRGSLDRPPCTEGIEHFVLQNSLKVNDKYLDWVKTNYKQAFRNIKGTNRKIHDYQDIIFYSKDFSVKPEVMVIPDLDKYAKQLGINKYFTRNDPIDPETGLKLGSLSAINAAKKLDGLMEITIPKKTYVIAPKDGEDMPDTIHNMQAVEKIHRPITEELTAFQRRQLYINGAITQDPLISKN